MTVVASDTQIMRGINAHAILRVLREQESASVAEIARALGLSRQAVTRSLAGLEKLGLVSFAAPSPTVSRAGRPAQRVQFHASAGYVLAISLAPGNMRAVLGDLAGAVVASRERELSASGDLVEQIVAGAIDLLTVETIERGSLWSAVVGVPGIVEPATGKVQLSASMPYAQELDLAASLASALGCRVYVDNEVKLATEGERAKGIATSFASMVLIEWGERIGAGLVLNASLYRGASNDSGDLGFLELRDSSRPPAEESTGLGPFESAVGGAEIVRQAAEAARSMADVEFAEALGGLPTTVALDKVIDRCLESSDFAHRALGEIARRFARGIAAIRALVDPEAVVLGGQMARCGPLLLDLLNDELKTQLLNQPRLVLSQLGREGSIHGALVQALKIVDEERLAPSALVNVKPILGMQEGTVDHVS